MVVVVMCFFAGALAWWAPFKKFLFLLLFLSLPFGLRVELPHFVRFGSGQLRQVTYEQHELPRLSSGTSAVFFTEGGHAAQRNAVLNRVVQDTVAFLLGFRQTHVGRFWIQALAEHRVAAAVVGVARGAVIGEMFHADSEVFGRGGNGIVKLAIGGRHC